MWKNWNTEIKVIFSVWFVLLHLFFAGIVFLFFAVTGGRGLGDVVETPTPSQIARWAAIEERESLEAFSESIQPCLYRSDAELNPCAPRSRFGFDHVIPHSSMHPEAPPAFEEMLLNPYRLRLPDSIPADRFIGYAHMVVRGVFDVGSTTCAGANLMWPEWVRDHVPTHSVNGAPEARNDLTTFQVSCFSEFSVHEYLVGRGPATLLVQHPNSSAVKNMSSDAYRDVYWGELDTLGPQIADEYEGIEWVAWLGPSYNGMWESLTAYALWDIQKDVDGIVRVVSPDVALYEDAGVRAGALDHLRAPLEDFRRGIAAAHTARMGLTTGRVSVDEYTPMLLTDVFELTDYYGEVGIYYHPIGQSQPPPTRPYPPTNLYAEFIAGARPEVRLKWTRPVGSHVFVYQILRVDNLGVESAIGTRSFDDPTYTDQVYPPAGSEYIYSIVATNLHGDSAPSAPYRLRFP